MSWRKSLLELHKRLHPNGPAAEAPKISTSKQFIVYTYYDHVPGMPSQEWMLSKWANAWEKAGFNPIVLSRKDALSHSHFEELEKRFASYPTVNPPIYELSCFRRWIAMVQVGGGLMVDYDVLPYGKFSISNGFVTYGEQGIELVSECKSELPLILHDHNPCPCAVYGTAVQWNNAVTWFANNPERCTKTEQGRPHASDQVGVQSGAPWAAKAVCFQYGSEGWNTAALVHYCHAACAGRPREQVIPAAEEMRGQVQRLVVPKAEPQAKATWIDSIRDRVSFLDKESKSSTNNRIRIMQELKRAGLVPGGIKFAPDRVKKVPFKKANKKQLV